MVAPAHHCGTRRQVWVIISCSIVLTVFYSYLDFDPAPFTRDHPFSPYVSLYNVPNNFSYLVNGSQCKIPSLDPFHWSIQKLITSRKYISCRKNLPHLVRLKKRTNNSSGLLATEHRLEIDRKAAKKYAKEEIKCCYQTVTRRKGEPVDGKFNRGKEVCFKGSTLLSNTTQMVTVTCYKKYFKTMRLKNNIVYENLFYIILLTETVKKKMKMQDERRHQNVVKLVNMDDTSHQNDVQLVEMQGKHLNDVKHKENKVEYRVERSLDEGKYEETQREEFPRKFIENVEEIQNKPLEIVENYLEKEQTTQFANGNNLNKRTVKNTEKTDLDLSYHYESNIKDKLDISEPVNNILRNNVTYETIQTYPVSFQEDKNSISAKENNLKRTDGDSTDENNANLHVDDYNKIQDKNNNDAKHKKRDKRSFIETNKSEVTKESGRQMDKKSQEFHKDENGINENSIQINEHKPKIEHKRSILGTFKNVVNKETAKMKEEPPEVQEEDLSLLIIGIDSISRLNMIRAMPKTRTFLTESGWFELEGYNKLGENTFPNLIPLLTGRSHTQLCDLCFPIYHESYFDPCPFIWHDLSRKGYITSYGEDIFDVSTFNYHKKGFREPPTDYYLRPLFAAGETKFKVSSMDSMKNWCVGSNSEAEMMLSYTAEFISQFSSYSFFNFIWMNAFSHNDVNSPSRMDGKVADFLAGLNYTALENTAILFFSDHGIRFGAIRQTYSGWFEERLPFIFFYLPEWYQKKYPRKISNLRANRNRLTSPYDVYHTLNDLTRLTNRSTCENCRSLLEPIPENRSCADVGISQHWCTCTEMINLSKEEPRGASVAKFVIGSLHAMFEKYKSSVLPKHHCANLTLHSIHSLQTNKQKMDMDMFLIRLETLPGNALFEATVVLKQGSYELTAEISRLNMYAGQDECLIDNHIRLYCYCEAD
uniref:Uncharacterized protein n=1 Tax=Cacopsylla melanoneura TaxID=428564 RepID=A0A8D8SUQ8_9HEMI